MLIKALILSNRWPAHPHGTVYFSGILGFSTTSKSFIPARSYTPHISGLI